MPDTILAVIAGSPVRPDGAGFLVIQAKDPDRNKSPGYAFIDWQGKKQKLKTPANLVELLPRNRRSAPEPDLYSGHSRRPLGKAGRHHQLFRHCPGGGYWQVGSAR